MQNSKLRPRYGRQFYLLKRIRTAGIVLFLALIITGSILFISRLKNNVKDEKLELLQVWTEGGYQQAYEISKAYLSAKPVNYFYLTINGFCAYQLGISQINNQNKLKFIDECIFSLRKALIHKESLNDGRVFYVLGKAYSNKGNEYADMAVKYLEKAASLSYDAQDINEYLGLAYAAYGDYRNSVEAFSRSFSPDRAPSDILLLSIARSYIAMEEYNTASAYLLRCIENSPDSKSILLARKMLAEIYLLCGDYDGAESQYYSILGESGEDADVHFMLGELYLAKGDNTRARSEWRTARRLNPAHSGAMARLN